MTKRNRPAPRVKQSVGADLLAAIAKEQQATFRIEEWKFVKAVDYEHTAECAEKGCKVGCAYIRQSKGEAESLAAQEASIARWVKKAESTEDCVLHIGFIVWDKTGAWTDDGPKPKRPGKDAIDAMVAAKTVDFFLARELTRIDRVLEDLLNWLRDCRTTGIAVYTSMDGIEGDCTDNKKLSTVIQVVLKGAMGSNESRMISERITENTIELRECGFWLGGLQTGYFPKGGSYIDTFDTQGNPIKELQAPRFPRTHSTGRTIMGKILEPVAGWKEAVEAASSVIITGGTLTKAAEAFHNAGFPCMNKHGDYEHQKARAWLTSPILIGYLSRDTEGELRTNRYNSGLRRLQYVQMDADGNIVRGVDPVMSMDRWLELQHAIQSRMDMRAPRTPFLLQGVLTCERCGYGMTRAKSVSGYTNYICLNTKRGTCGGVNISMARIDEYIESEMLKRYDPAQIENSRLAYEEEIERLKAAMPTGHTEELAELSAKLNLITDMLLDETSPAGRENLKKKRDDITKKIDELQTFQAQMPSAPSMSVLLDGADIDGYSLADLWTNLPIEKRNAFIRSAVESIQIKTVKRNQSEGNGRFLFDPSRVVIWWRGTSKPLAWDQQHASHLEVSA